MGKAPAFQFYPGDWLKDPAVARCSPETRGIWIDLLCSMHESGRSGQVIGTADQLARLCRCTTAACVAALKEIADTGAGEVSLRDDIYTVVNRRMKREADIRQKALQRLKKHRCKIPETVPKRERNAPSSSSPSGNPPNPPSGGERGEENSSAKNELAAAIAEVAGKVDSSTDPAAEFCLSQQPPVTPAEVREFGERFAELIPIERRKGRTRPYTNEIKNNVLLVRSNPRRKSLPSASPMLAEISPEEKAKAAALLAGWRAKQEAAP